VWTLILYASIYASRRAGKIVLCHLLVRGGSGNCICPAGKTVPQQNAAGLFCCVGLTAMLLKGAVFRL